MSNEIACLGLGTMGGSMTRQLLLAGNTVYAYNRSAARREALADAVPPEAQKRLHLCTEPLSAVKRAQVIMTCLSDDAALEALLLEPGQCLAAMAPGALLLDTGTTSLGLTQRLAKLAQTKGLSFVDAPMTGSLLGARNGTLTFMVGGSQSDVTRVMPLLEAMGKHVVHVADWVGAGQSAKCCLNMGQAVVLQGILEAYALASKLQVPLSAMAEIFENSAGKTGVGTFKTPYLQNKDYTPHFRLDLMQKDLHLALDQASQTRMPLPAAQAVRLVYDQGVAEGWGEEDFLVLARLLERWGGFAFAAKPEATQT